MGADYSATVVIGVPLPAEEDLPRAKKLVRKKAFKHDYEDDGQTEFDKKTGKKLFLDEKEEVEEDFPAFLFNDDRVEDDSQKVIKLPKGLGVAYGTDGDNPCLGLVAETGNSNGGDDYAFMKIPDLEALKEKIKGVLEPLELWNEEDFGVHLVLCCSY